MIDIWDGAEAMVQHSDLHVTPWYISQAHLHLDSTKF